MFISKKVLDKLLDEQNDLRKELDELKRKLMGNNVLDFPKPLSYHYIYKAISLTDLKKIQDAIIEYLDIEWSFVPEKKIMKKKSKSNPKR